MQGPLFIIECITAICRHGRLKEAFAHMHKCQIQRRSQNAEKVTHIKGRLLEQADIISIASLFKMVTSLKGKKLFPEGASSFL